MSRFNVGGTSKWLYHLCKGLDENGIENILVIGDCPDYEIEDTRIKELRSERIPGLNPSSSIPQSIRAFLLLRKLIRHFEPDLINTHASKGGFIGRLAAYSVLQKPKVIHTYHGHVLRGYFSWPKQNAIYAVEFALSFISDAFIVVGQKVLTELKELRIVRNKFASSVVPAVEDFAKGIQESLHNSPNIPRNTLVVGWLGRKVQIKRLDRILEIAKLRPEIHFVIAGVGNSVFTSYKDRFHKEELSNVTEIGFISPEVFWPLCDISIITSDNEGIPSAPIEAAIANVPTVTTNVGSAAEVVEDGVSGFVTRTDLNDLLEKIDLLAKNRTLREEMGRRARILAMNKFDPDNSVNSQIAIYRKILE